jgi:hypothetical protein
MTHYVTWEVIPDGSSPEVEAVSGVSGSSRSAGQGWGVSMEKWLCWGAIGVAGLMLLLFLLDIVVGIPFGGLSATVDVFGILASGLVLFLGWDAMRDLR